MGLFRLVSKRFVSQMCTYKLIRIFYKIISQLMIASLLWKLVRDRTNEIMNKKSMSMETSSVTTYFRTTDAILKSWLN